MNYLGLFAVALIAGIVLRIIGTTTSRLWTKLASWVSFGIAILMVAASSFVVIDQERVGHLKRVIWGSNMQPGQIIALAGEKGPQARILGPGFHVIPAVRLLYTIEQFPVIEIPQGRYGLLTARDGDPLKPNQFMADGWNEADFENMLNADHAGGAATRKRRRRRHVRGALWQTPERAAGRPAGSGCRPRKVRTST